MENGIVHLRNVFHLRYLCICLFNHVYSVTTEGGKMVECGVYYGYETFESFIVNITYGAYMYSYEIVPHIHMEGTVSQIYRS